MKLTEIIISLLIFSLTVSCFFYSFEFLNKTGKRFIYTLSESKAILITDEELRSEINNCQITYWQNAKRSILSLEQKILNKKFHGNIKIISVEKIFDKNGMPEGLIVYWSYKNICLETKEKFNNRVFFYD